MLLGPVFDRFVTKTPLSVMARATLECVLCPPDLDALFERCADQQYTRDLLFSTTVDLLSQVVCGIHKTVNAAYQAADDDIGVSVTSVYNKLAGVEPHTSAETVRFCAGQLAPVIAVLGPSPAWLPGYRTRLLDGNHLAATEHRLKETRQDAAGPLPGFCLVTLDAASGLADDVFPCEDGHTQERALLDDVLQAVRARDLWLGDRNFCVARFLLGIAARGGFFIIREHAQVRCEANGQLRRCGRIETGRVWEQPVLVTDDAGNQLAVRRVTLVLDEPTRDGETEIVLLSNLPESAADAETVARLYHKRWTIEGMFQEMATALHAEIKTLCYPRAALLGFCLGLVAMNVFAGIRAALRAAHGQEAVEEVSGYYVADELSGTYRGMMIAIPAEEWLICREMTTKELAGLLRKLAAKVRLEKFRRHRRGAKKAPTKRRYNKKKPHVSTARLLQQRKKKKITRDITP
jgi:Transposase DDE domain